MPMLRLRRLEQAGWPCAEIWAKLEFLSPGGSVKDRAALGLVLDAERRGVLRPGGTIVEATAGNTGVGLALIGVNRGYKVMLYVPEQFAEEKCKLMRGLGATVVRTPEADGMAGGGGGGRGVGVGGRGEGGRCWGVERPPPEFFSWTTPARPCD